MPTGRYIFGLFIIVILLVQAGCGPKSVTSDPALLHPSTQDWNPYSGSEQITFFMDDDTMIFNGYGKQTYFERVRYMTDQSGFFTTQKDFYADLERQKIMFHSESSNYYLQVLLEKGKSEAGEWDILNITMADGAYYKNDIRIVTYETDSYEKGEVFKVKEKVTLNGNLYRKVYYTTQDRRPFELYFTKDRGIIGFKTTSAQIWTIDPDKLD